MDPITLRKKIVFFLLAISVLAAIAFWSMLFIKESKNVHELPVLSTVAPFSFTERSSRPVTLDQLKGNIWVADFIFTSCAGPCPMMTRRMSQLQTAFAHASDVRLVSFSIDPEHDTPAVLSQYAQQFDADDEKWLFLTGDKASIIEFAKNSLKVTVKAATDTSPIIHSTYFILVDKAGNIRGYYNSSEPNSLSQLAVDVEKLRQKSGA